MSHILKMQEEIDILQTALRDIAHALIQDAEHKDPELISTQHIHLSASTPIPQKYRCYQIQKTNFTAFFII